LAKNYFWKKNFVMQSNVFLLEAARIFLKIFQKYFQYVVILYYARNILEII